VIMDTSYVLFALMLFVAVVLALEGAYTIWASKNSAESKRLAARLSRVGGPGTEARLSIERTNPRNHWNWLDDHLIALLPNGDRLLRYLETSGTGTTAGELIVSSAGFGLVGFFAPLMLGRPLLFSLAGALLIGALPWWRLSRRRDKRIRLFEKQIPEALDLMGRAMRAGHAFPTAVQMVGDEMADPIGEICLDLGAADALQRHLPDRRQGDRRPGVHGEGVGQGGIALHHQEDAIPDLEFTG